jgi:small subunit ribosomal protein S17
MSDFYGTVVKTSNAKSAKVRIERIYTHPIYKKQIKKFTYLIAHDELGVQVGDQVCVCESKPISKTKRHIVKSKC